VFLFIEPISNNIGMYVPAYPLPLIEIASYIKAQRPDMALNVISVPMDHGLPLTPSGKERVYGTLMEEISETDPIGIGFSCTAISQAEELIGLCDRIKREMPDIFIFVGGYFPTLYYGEMFSRTSSIDVIVRGEGEISSLRILEHLEKGISPKTDRIPNLVWKTGDHLHQTPPGPRFDLGEKGLIDLGLLKHPGAYDILPYAFSRGCPFKCNFCMEDYIRPRRLAVPAEIIDIDLENLIRFASSRTLLVSDALFQSFDLFPQLRRLGVRVNFETRCDVLDPAILPGVADVVNALALGFESASYGTLKRMNKVRDRDHYRRYVSNAREIFKVAAENEIPIMVFMIAGYPGDTEKDLVETLEFAEMVSGFGGAGGHVFKIGECHVYPKTKIDRLARSIPGVIFDDDGVFGQNVVRQPSGSLDFDTVLSYVEHIFSLSSRTPKLEKTLRDMMPFFRLPAPALRDDMILDKCYRDDDREILNVHRESLALLKEKIPGLLQKYESSLAGGRTLRRLKL
jgi:radical SAM superfamily enzyme YgiQ (UPF0313 family)